MIIRKISEKTVAFDLYSNFLQTFQKKIPSKKSFPRKKYFHSSPFEQNTLSLHHGNFKFTKEMTKKTCPVCGRNEFRTVLTCTDHYVSQETFEIAECVACGMRITGDFPAEEAIGKYYETSDYISHSDTKKGLVNSLYHRVRQQMLRKKANWITKSTGLEKGTILDVGTGTGYFANAMKELGWTVSVVEKSLSAREFAEKNFKLTAYPSMDNFVKKHKLSGAEPLDAITLWHVLEHLEQLNETMEQFGKLLKPGGTLAIAVPNCESYDARKYKNHWAAYDVPRHLWHFRKKQMNILAKNHGFTISEIKKMPFDAFYISMMSEKYAGHTAPFIRGILTGTAGYVASLLDNSKSSSLVYVLKKQNTN